MSYAQWTPIVSEHERVTCYVCGNDDDRTCADDSPRLVRYRWGGRWRRVIACWNCREIWADRIEAE
jgi:hypothetical protein